MKRLLTVLILCLVFSPNLFAKKTEIKGESSGDLEVTVSDSACDYNATSIFTAFTHGHRSMRIDLVLMVGKESLPPLYSREFSENQDFGPRVAPHFSVDMGEDWTLAWVLVRTKGKGRVVDAIETLSGTCTNP